jgi:hypothetical protein
VTAERESNGAPAPEAQLPRIVITFAGPGVADMAISPDGTVSVSQVFAAAWLLDAFAHELRAKQVTIGAAQGLLVPRPGMVPPASVPRRS